MGIGVHQRFVRRLWVAILANPARVRAFQRQGLEVPRAPKPPASPAWQKIAIVNHIIQELLGAPLTTDGSWLRLCLR